MPSLRALFVIALWTAPSVSIAEVNGFVESFNGNGEYDTINAEFRGLDNPGWEIIGDGHFEDGGFLLENQGGHETEQPVSDVLVREVIGRGSFSTRLEIDRFDLGDLNEEDSRFSGGIVVLRQNLDLSQGKETSQLLMALSENFENEAGMWLLTLASGLSGRLQTSVPSGSHVALGVHYDDSLSQTSFSYDDDITDDTPALAFGPFPYTETFAEVHTTSLFFTAVLMGTCDGLIDYWAMLPLSDVPGDFDGNGNLDAADIDQLSAQLRAGSSDATYDLNADSVVDDLDRQIWVHDLKQTFFGDADLSGTFDSTDLVQVLAFGEYEDDAEPDATWLTGDWDGDGGFTSGDLVVALADGGYEAGPRAAVVPEPGGIVLLMAAGPLAMCWAGKAARVLRGVRQFFICLRSARSQSPVTVACSPGRAIGYLVRHSVKIDSSLEISGVRAAG